MEKSLTENGIAQLHQLLMSKDAEPLMSAIECLATQSEAFSANALGEALSDMQEFLKDNGAKLEELSVHSLWHSRKIILEHSLRLGRKIQLL